MSDPERKKNARPEFPGHFHKEKNNNTISAGMFIMACQFLLAVRVVLNYTSRAITVSQRKLRKKKQAKVPRHYADKSNPHYAERKTRKTSAASPLRPRCTALAERSILGGGGGLRRVAWMPEPTGPRARSDHLLYIINRAREGSMQDLIC